MKAFWAYQVDTNGFPDDWGMFIHGETYGKAKSRALHCEPSGEWEYIFIRLERRPKLDGLPFTDENVGNMVYYDDDDDHEYANDCNCSICSPETRF